MMRRLFSCLLALALVTAAAPAQAPAPPPKAPQAAPQEAPPVRVTTRLVQVSVVVKDRKGKPVDGLTRDDFRLSEDGKPQQVQMFAVEKLELAPAAAPPPPGTFSNYLDQRGNRPNSVTVILLDGLNTRFQDQAYSRLQIIKFLKQLQPGDRIALYTLGRKLTILHDFTDDTGRLLRALERHRGRAAVELATSDFEPADTGDTELDAFLDDANTRISDFYTVNRVRVTIQALELISQHLAGFPGRKNLVWVSSAFPFHIGMDSMELGSTRDRRVFGDEITRAVRALNAANTAIYPVDASGLEAPFPTPTGPVRGRAGLPPRTLGLARYDRLDTMNDLAERTGGRAFYNTNDIQGAIRRAIDDSQVSYVLGFYPTHEEWTGKYHKLKVQMTRPRLNARYRQGYFALPEPSFNENEAERMMKATAWNPLDATGLRVAVRAWQFYVAGADRIKLELHFVPQDVRLIKRDGQYVGALELVFSQRTGNGKVYSTRVYRQGLKISEQGYERIMTEGMTLSRDFDLLRDAELVMVVVRDPESGQMGSVRIPLDKLPPEGPG